ncbi:MAG: hypothetical protein ABJ263_05100 [Tateyamaria sp.]|uniref:hypothetical protein n=1 Tax=Tateyamaria sp. TaxID=1929288 RepID=UPI003287AA60
MQYEPIPGQPQFATEEETMAIIRAVLIEDEEPKPSRKAARLARQKCGSADMDWNPERRSGESLRSFVARKSGTKPRRRADILPALAEVEPETPPATRTPWVVPWIAQAGSFAATLVRRVLSFRPSTRQLAMACLALLVVVRPHWFVIGGSLLLGSVAGIFLVFGSDRIWRGVVSYLRRIDARDPVRGVLLRERMDWWACRWDAVLDHFPDGMVDGLYMPDLQAMETAEAAHTYAMAQRLARMAHDT